MTQSKFNVLWLFISTFVLFFTDLNIVSIEKLYITAFL